MESPSDIPSSQFAPWSYGSAHRHEDGKITGTIPLRADAGLRLVSAEIDADGQFLTCVFEPLPEE